MYVRAIFSTRRAGATWWVHSLALLTHHLVPLTRSSTTHNPLVHQHGVEPQLFTHVVASLACSLLAGPLEVTDMRMGPFHSAASAIEACLIIPSARRLILNRMPARVHANSPLEIGLVAVGLGASTGAASAAHWISAHTLMSIEIKGRYCSSHSVPVSVRPSGGGWVARALVDPAAWAHAASVTVASVSLTGQPLPCDSIPATLRVGYNHAPAPAGPVFKASQAGDVSALQAALDAGGSIKEATDVRWGWVG